MSKATRRLHRRQRMNRLPNQQSVWRRTRHGQHLTSRDHRAWNQWAADFVNAQMRLAEAAKTAAESIGRLVWVVVPYVAYTQRTSDLTGWVEPSPYVEWPEPVPPTLDGPDASTVRFDDPAPRTESCWRDGCYVESDTGSETGLCGPHLAELRGRWAIATPGLDVFS